jgi:hypothetical protein
MGIDAVGVDQLQDGRPINMRDQELTRQQGKDFSETSTTPVVRADVLTLDLDTGNAFRTTLTEDVASLIPANLPAAGCAGPCALTLKQDATGGRTITWPSSVRWPGGSPPATTIAANAPDAFGFVTRDGSATRHGFPGRPDFS